MTLTLVAVFLLLLPVFNLSFSCGGLSYYTQNYAISGFYHTVLYVLFLDQMTFSSQILLLENIERKVVPSAASSGMLSFWMLKLLLPFSAVILGKYHYCDHFWMLKCY
jgi:hypothetical protein